MPWPPSTHQDVQDAITANRGQIQFPAGVYVTAPGTVSTGTAGTVGTAYYMPISLPSGTVSELACRLSAAATAGSGGTVQLGLYDTSATIHATIGRVPGNLLVSGTAISTESVGPKVMTVSQAVTGGLYWVAMLPLVAAATFINASGDANTGRVGVGDITGIIGHVATQAGLSSLPASATIASITTGARGWLRMSAVT